METTTTTQETQPTPDTTTTPVIATATTTAPEPKPEPKPLDPAIQAACDIAAGRTQEPQDAPALHIRAAHVSKSMRGAVQTEWYRMVWRDGAWSYFADDRLDMRARRSTAHGDVYAGELVCEHSRGAGVDDVMVAYHDGTEPRFARCTFARRKCGLRVTLPDGSSLDLPDPRRK